MSEEQVSPEEQKKREAQAGAVFDMIIAGMLDAATTRHLSQFKTIIVPPWMTRPVPVRIIIVPETMDMEYSKPLERKT